MHDPDARARNVIAAFALAAADGIRQAVEETVGQGGAGAAALVTVGAYPGRGIEQLRRPLGLSQPGAVRLVDRLEREGRLERREARGRALALHLTQSGEAVVEQLVAARDAVVSELLGALDPEELAAAAVAAEKVLGARTSGRPELERLCRLCRREACYACPVASALR